jgi:hypothetical protein
MLSSATGCEPHPVNAAAINAQQRTAKPPKRHGDCPPGRGVDPFDMPNNIVTDLLS